LTECKYINPCAGVEQQVTSLKKLGHHTQLGHPIDQCCILLQQAFNNDFVLIDTDGIHEIALDFCGCEMSQTHVKQLLHHGCFPVTSTDPRTAVTFWLLYHYQIVSFESKASAYEFYHLLMHLMDNTGMMKQKVHLYLPTTSKYLIITLRIIMKPSCGTSEGECMVLCPACPQPGKNLPIGWENAAKAKWCVVII
jgi:hypothetical protein